MSWPLHLISKLERIAVALEAQVELQARDMGVPSPLGPAAELADAEPDVDYMTDAASAASEQARGPSGPEPAALPGPPLPARPGFGSARAGVLRGPGG